MLQIFKSDKNVNGQFIYLPEKIFHLYSDSIACLVKVSNKYAILVRIRLCEDVNLENCCFIESPVHLLSDGYFNVDENNFYSNSISKSDIQPLKTKKTAKEIEVILVCKCLKAIPKLKNSNLAKQVVFDILSQYLVLVGCAVQCKLSKLSSIIVTSVSGVHSDVYEVNSQTKIYIRQIVSSEYFNQLYAPSKIFERYKKVFESDAKCQVPVFAKLNSVISRIIRNSSDCNLNDKMLLLAGPPGSGKTFLVRSIAHSLKKVILTISCRELNVANFIHSLKTIVTEANAHIEAKEECIILIKYLDYICNVKSEQQTAKSVLLAKQVKLVFDDVRKVPGLSVIATSTCPENIIPALKNYGCFNQEIEIPILADDDRKSIYTNLAEYYHLPCTESFSNSFAKWTIGYVFADILLAMREAFNLLLDNEEQTEAENLNLLKKAVACNLASTLRGTKGLVQSNKVTFNDIGGMEDVKKTLRMCVQWQMEHPEAFARLGISPTRGVLLHGPPGCAKTTLVKALAQEAGVTFIAASAADIYSPYVGEAEKKLARLFTQARIGAPAIIFIDEIDGLVGSKDGNRENGVQERILATLLMEMDGVGTNIKTDDALTKITNDEPSNAERTLRIVNNSRIIVVSATNRLDKIDDALKRPGRFDKLIYIPLPNHNERLNILRKFTSNMAVAEDVDLTYIANQTEGLSGAALKNVCMESALFALTSRGMDVLSVTQRDFVYILENLKR